MSPGAPKNTGRTITLSAAAVGALMDERGITTEELAGRADVSPRTITNVLSGQQTYRKTANSIASALGVSLPTLLSERMAASTVETVHEYLLAEVLADWVTASNGLRFQVCRMRHTELDRQVRAKRFDLREMPTDEQQRCRTWIKRHPVVCDRIGAHPNIARNLTAFHDPRDGFYWVIDEWVSDILLEPVLRRGPMELVDVRRLTWEVARGLASLHEQNIIRRELSPSSILLREPDRTAVLTDFELAKLVDHGPTVSSGDWPADPYRAPEADGEDVTRQADLYSWARIVSHCLLGSLPPVGNDVQALKEVELPAEVREVFAASLSLLRSGRPRDFSEIMPVIAGWREG